MRRPDQRGSATAEVAILLPGLVLFLALLLAAGSGAVTRIRCIDAARVGARLAARGEGDAAVLAAVRIAAPAHSAVSVSRASGTVTVRVSAPAELPLAGVSAITVEGSATAALESSFGLTGDPASGTGPTP